MSSEQNALLEIDKILKSVQLKEARNQRPRTFQRLRIDLDVATKWTNPLEYNGGFKSLFVESVSDPNAYCFFKPNSPNEDQDYAKLAMRDSWAGDGMTSRAFFSWPSQPGKWVEILLFFDSTFQSGSYTQIQAGGVNLSDGATVTTANVLTLLANTRAIIAPVDATRKCATIQNKTGGDLYIGDVTVDSTGAKAGIVIADGATIEWRNSAALYGISVSGGDVARMEEA